MLFCVITFFTKFALVLFFTIVQATVGSFVILLTLMDCIGPTQPTYWADKLADRFKQSDIVETSKQKGKKELSSTGEVSDESPNSERQLQDGPMTPWGARIPDTEIEV